MTTHIEFHQLDHHDSQAEKLNTIRGNVSRLIAQITTAVMSMDPDGTETGELFHTATQLQAIHDSL